MMQLPINDVYDYLDYREFLKDEFRSRKKASQAHSLRYIAAITGLDASMLAKLTTYKAHLSPQRLKSLIGYLGFDESQSGYFALLLQYSRTKIKSESDMLLDKILSWRPFNATDIETNQLLYFQHWYHVVIREAIGATDFNGEFKKLASSISPPISEKQAFESIRLLLELGIIHKDPSGSYSLTDRFVTSKSQKGSKAVADFQKQMFELAVGAHDRLPKTKRSLSTATVSLSQKGFEALRERFAAFRQESMEIARSDQNVDGVYQINLQLFEVAHANNK
jgi:uncharacterized protein (TIGR02147 family)